MQKTVIYVSSGYSKKVKDLIYFTNKLRPLLNCNQTGKSKIVKIYVENLPKEKEFYTAYNRMLRYLKSHPEIEFVTMSYDESILKNYERILNLFILNRKINIIYDLTFSKTIFIENL